MWWCIAKIELSPAGQFRNKTSSYRLKYRLDGLGVLVVAFGLAVPDVPRGVQVATLVVAVLRQLPQSYIRCCTLPRDTTPSNKQQLPNSQVIKTTGYDDLRT